MLQLPEMISTVIVAAAGADGFLGVRGHGINPRDAKHDSERRPQLSVIGALVSLLARIIGLHLGAPVYAYHLCLRPY